MDVKDKMERLRVGLRDSDVNVCGGSPKWIQEELLKRVDALIENSSDSISPAEAEGFVVGALRFVADRCGNECDQLMESLSDIA